MANVQTAEGPSFGGRMLERVLGGRFGERRRVAELKHIEQIPVYDRFWRERPREGSIRYLALGDSLAQGIGLDDPEHNYVGGIERSLRNVHREPVATHNVSISGARTEEVLERQLPLLAAVQPDIVTLSIGGNDVTQPEWDARGFEQRMRDILAELPAGAIVSDVPTLGFGRYERRSREANEIIHGLSADEGFDLAPVYQQTRKFVPFGVLKRMSDDFFHPNALGHEAWITAFESVLTQRAAPSKSIPNSRGFLRV